MKITDLKPRSKKKATFMPTKYKGNMFILVDRREQLSYWSGSQCADTTLIVGDYTTIALLNKVHVERKSPQDLYQTITKNNRRFHKEVMRAHEHGIKLYVFTECSKKDFIAKAFQGGELRKFPGESLGRIVDTFRDKYGVIFQWYETRNKSKEALLKLLGDEEKKLRKSLP